MLLKLAALSAIGYAGYRYYQKNMDRSGAIREGSTPNVSDPQIALAGGPLSSDAGLMRAGEPLPGQG